MQTLETQPTPDQNNTQETGLLSLAERHPDWPKLDVRFYFSPHHSKADFEGIEPYLEEADIYLVEHNAGKQDAIEDLHQISISPPYSKKTLINRGFVDDTRIKGSFREPIMKGIYNSQKVIGSIDLRDEVEEERVIGQEISKISSGSPVPKMRTFDEALDELAEHTARYVELQEKREKIIAGRFEEEIGRILETHPHLKEKDNLNILISMGAYHTRLTHAFSERNIPTDRKFPSSTYVYSPQAELQRTLAYSREPSRDLVEKAYAEVFLKHVLLDNIRNAEKVPYDDVVKYMRAVLPKLSHEDVEDIYHHHNNDLLTVEFFDDLLSSHGLKRVPRNIKELTSPFIVDEQSKTAKRARDIGRRTLGFFRGKKMASN